MVGFWNDLRYAVRSLRRTPTLAAAAIVTIALGVGVNTGIYSIINGVLFGVSPLDTLGLIGAVLFVLGVAAAAGGAAARAATRVDPAVTLQHE